MQAYGKNKIKHNYPNHSYRLLKGSENWWEYMGEGSKKSARQEAKELIKKEINDNQSSSL